MGQQRVTAAASPLRLMLAPSHKDERELVRAELFARALSQRLGRPVVVELAASYEQLDEELAAGRVDMAWGSAEQCSAQEPHARAVLRAVRGGRWSYHSALVCRAEQPLSLERLSGARVAWVAPRSTGGHLLPLRLLQAQGLRPEHAFSEQQYHGTYRRALQAVLEGRADVAPVYTPLPDEATVRACMASLVGAEEQRLLPFCFTSPTLSDGLILTRRLSEQEAAELVALLTSLGRTSGGGLEPLMGLFDSEGFMPTVGAQAVLGEPRPARPAELLVAEVDEQQRCRRLWAPLGRVFGQQVSGGEGRSLAQVLGAEAAAPLEALLRSAWQGPLGGRLEYRLLVEGEVRWYAAEAVACTPEGAARGPMALLVREVSERRALEEGLYELASFPLLHPEPMVELGPEGELRYANPAAHRAFPELLLRGASHPLVEAARAWARRGPSPSEALPVVSLGDSYWELTVAALPDMEGLRLFAKNVTTRRHMEARLQHADRLASLGSLAAAVGHEVNNPLSFITANLSFSREELGRLREQLRHQGPQERAQELDDVLEALDEAAEGADQIRRIIQDLRLLSRTPPERRLRVDVRQVLENALQLVRSQLRHVHVERELLPVPAVLGDEVRVAQVLVNLLLNAAQAMGELGTERHTLWVRTRVGRGGEVVVEVQDTGEGMGPEVLARLFEPFFSTRVAGTGLGLAVSHAIVTSLGGTLRAESRPGVGTTMRMVLPAAPEEAED